jgi:D-proline reductase (dithiol) PrdB|tara:strand:+ start:1769 stop:2212 length:444 start_codon:yes stop_codon:yes gene_type:complete
MREDQVPKELANAPCPQYDVQPWVAGPPIQRRRVALISTAGLMHRGDRPFTLGSVDYRIIDIDSDEDILMSHVSPNFDRTGFAQDHNVALPIDRLKEMADNGEIGSVARYHYSFMGATEPEKMEPAARLLAANLIGDNVDLALMVPI